jgi:arginyl-tRNA synthetase
VITADLRHAIARATRAAGYQPGDPGLRPGGAPGRYASSVAFAAGENPLEAAAGIARLLGQAPGVASAEVTGPGFITVTVTPEALAAVADGIITAGPGCVASDALAGVTVHGPPPGDPLAPGPHADRGEGAAWEVARAALAARLTARLAAAAGATVTEFADSERKRLPRVSSHPSPVTRAVAFAGRDAVTFMLARAAPGRPLRVDERKIARHVPGNPAYAVRYAHARAASGLRWAASSQAAGTPAATESGRSPLRDSLLDALSWLPERVATAARRGRPDEFARYLEELASVTIDVLSCACHVGSAPNQPDPQGSDRLALASAARTALAAGLELLEVSAPDRLLARNLERRALSEPWFAGGRWAQ